MANFNEIHLAKYFINKDRKSFTYASATILCWLYHFGDAKVETIHNFLTSYIPEIQQNELNDITKSVYNVDIFSLQMACELFIKYVSDDSKEKFLKFAIIIAIDDGYITFAEREFLLFISDIFNISKDKLHSIYIDITGCNFPDPLFLDSKSWWESKEGRKRNNTNNNTHMPSQRLHDLALLGLNENATIDEIKRAYHRLAKIHHPDLFQKLGDKEFEEASKSFKMIKDAYERLIK